MKRFFMYVFMALLASVSLTYAGEPASMAPEVVNVMNFGAKGDGRTDDTQAIRDAVGEAFSRRRIPQHPQYGYFTTFAEVYFPSGHYIVSDTININAVNIRGEAYAAIEQKDPEEDIFYNSWAWRQKIEGMTFLGGKVQLNLGNGNVDTGHVTVINCHFYHSGDVAVQMRRGSNSTFFKVENCVFRDCEQAVINHCDMGVIKDTWISTSRNMKNKAAVVNYGVMIMENMLGVPRPNGFDQRWIDNYGALTVKNSRFGGEGAGFTPIVNFAKFRPALYGPSVVLEDSWVFSLGNNLRPCAVYLEEIPNQVVIRNNMLGGVPALMISPEIDIDTYFESARPGMLNFDVAGNTGEFSGALPKKMIELSAMRDVVPYEYGDSQLSGEETMMALEAAVKRANTLPGLEPGVAAGRSQQTAPEKYVNITPSTHVWDLNDFLDGVTEVNIDYLAVAEAEDDIILLQRIEDGTSYPHVRIRNVEVNLEEAPLLTWRIRGGSEGMEGGSHAVKVFNHDTRVESLLTEWKAVDQSRYFVYDLREVFGLESGTVNVDIKFYLLSTRAYGALDFRAIRKGEYFIIDFIRLEAEQ